MKKVDLEAKILKLEKELTECKATLLAKDQTILELVQRNTEIAESHRKIVHDIMVYQNKAVLQDALKDLPMMKEEDNEEETK